MKKRLLFLPALVVAGAAAAQGTERRIRTTLKPKRRRSNIAQPSRASRPSPPRSWGLAQGERGGRAAGGHVGHQPRRDPGARPPVTEPFAARPAEAARIARANDPAPRAAHHARKLGSRRSRPRSWRRTCPGAKESAEASASSPGAWRPSATCRSAQAREQAFYAEATAQLARAQPPRRRRPRAPRAPRGPAGRPRPSPSRSPARASAGGRRRRHGLDPCAPGGARGVPRLPHGVRRRAALPRRNRVAAQADLGGGSASLQRHAGERLELLADSWEQAAAVQAFIEALRDFWLAEADLQAALAAGGS